MLRCENCVERNSAIESDPQGPKVTARSQVETARVKLGPSQNQFLLPEVGANDGILVFRQAAYDFLRKIVAAGSPRVAVALLECGAALFDIFLEAIVEVPVPAAVL